MQDTYKQIAQLIDDDEDAAVPPAIEGGEAGALPAPGADYDVEKINRDHSLVLMGAHALVVKEQAAGPMEDRLRFITVTAFETMLRNTSASVFDGKKMREMTHATRWLADPERRSYNGIEFLPNPDG